jgi:hypothetical protein
VRSRLQLKYSCLTWRFNVQPDTRLYEELADTNIREEGVFLLCRLEVLEIRVIAPNALSHGADEPLVQIESCRAGRFNDSAVEIVSVHGGVSVQPDGTAHLTNAMGLPVPSGMASTIFWPTRRMAALDTLSHIVKTVADYGAVIKSLALDGER